MNKANTHLWSTTELDDALDPVVRNKLSIILSRLVLGDKTVLITPVGERVGPDVLFHEWSKIFYENANKMNNVLIDIEENQAAKQGPRSVALPWEDIRDQARSSWSEATHSCEHLSDVPIKSSDRGIIRPISVENAVKSIKMSTNSGLPYLSKKSTVIARTTSNLEEDYDENWPMVPFIRTQEQKKTRLVKGYPTSDVIIESRYFEPLFQYYSRQSQFAAMRGPDSVNTAMTKLLSETVRLGQKAISLDISGFDDSFKKPLQDKVFGQMSYLLQPGHETQFSEIAWRFGNKQLVTPDGIWSGAHGIPSGSRGTNLVGSVGNDLVLGQPLRQVLGDDAACASADVTTLFRNYDSCGLELNESKTVVADGHFLFLQQLFHPDYMEDGEVKGVYPTFRCLNRLIYPERFSEFNTFGLDGKSYFAIRSLSILENCRYHPLFEELVKFWMRYEKYAIPSNQSIAKYVQYLRSTTGSVGTSNQYGSDVRGLTNFESYKLALRYAR